MTLRERLTEFLDRPEARALSQINPDVNQGRFFNMLGTSLLQAPEVRQAYSGLIFMLLNYRSTNFARWMPKLKVSRRTGQDEHELVPFDHPWLQLIRRPNDGINYYKFWEWVFVNRDLHGHADLYVQYSRVANTDIRVPSKLYPIYSEFGTMRRIIDSMGLTDYWLYDMGSGETVELRPYEVIRIERPHPTHPGRSASLVEAAAYDIDEQTAASIYGRDVARAKGRPDVMLEVDKFMEEDQLRRLSANFAKQYHTQSMGGVPVASGGLKIKPLELNMRDAQFIESRKFSTSRIHELFETPEGLFSDKSNRANADAALFNFAVQTIQPNLIAVAANIEFEFERIFNADPSVFAIIVPNSVPVDEEKQARVNEIKIRSGQISINKILKAEGQEGVEGGDQHFLPSNLMPLEAFL